MMNEKNVIPVCPHCNCILYEVEDDLGHRWMCEECEVETRPA